jgi:ligand-binding sensor domain-containing protein/tRNA A-37 threonylcarbamoyl transferase component Bud32
LRNLRGLIFVALSLLCFSGFLSALDPEKMITQYSLSTWKTERGLPNNTVLAITQDRAGYLWLGTVEGLVRFDGVNFTAFNSKNTPEFDDDFVNNLFVDHHGILWIGMIRGKLFSLEQGKFQAHHLADSAFELPNYCMEEDDRGDLWVGTSEGMFYRSPGAKGIFKRHSAFFGKEILCLAKDRSGRMLASTNNKGLYKKEGDRWRPVLSATVHLDSDVSVIRMGSDGNAWLGTQKRLYHFQDDRLLDYSPLPGLKGNINALIKDRDGNLWGGSEEGVFRWQNGSFQSIRKGEGLDSNYVYALSEDVEGSLWVGSVDGGLTQIRDEKLTSLTDQEGLAGSIFRSLRQDDSGAMWIGGFGGKLNRFHHGRCENFTLPSRFQDHTVISLEMEADQSLWLGTSDGIIHFKNSHAREIVMPVSGGRIEVRCIKKDHAGRLWIGTWGKGVYCRQNGEFTAFSMVCGLPSDRIASIYEDRRKNLWIGCENGLAVMPLESKGKFSVVPFLQDGHVVSFFEDAAGTLWVGTRNQGIKILKDGQWGSLDSDHGLFDNRVYAIMEDGLGYLWLSSERGIFRVEKSELEKAAFDKNLKVSGRLFDENDGMKNRICNYGNPAGWKDETGRLWFANLVGVVSIDPAHIKKNERVPPVLVEEVVVDNHSLPTGGNSLAVPLRLAAGSKRFEFKYTALSFIRSDKIEFKYKLEGYDKDWTAASNRREAFYNNLKPGRYRFRVIAANADGVWNTAGASFAFYLKPFIYQTWWFMVLAAMAFMIVSVLLWQLLKKYLRAVTFWKKKTHIGHFRILETIGTGGMATVYKAQDMLDRKRVVALKVLKEENFHDENQKKRFKHESLITEQLDHPHIVRIIERGELEDCWYIAMELLSGQSLAMLIKRGGRLEIAAALDIMLQIVDALRAIHGRNIVHRDLKPENIMISERRGRPHYVKLLDFGLAITPAQSRLTMSGVVMGTIRYLPPERISDGASSPAGDIYSAGIILYEMLTGSKPFWSEATGEVIHRILETYPLPAREINPGIPRELEALIKAMIDKDPARRPALDAVENELRRLAAKFSSAPETLEG